MNPNVTRTVEWRRAYLEGVSDAEILGMRDWYEAVPGPVQWYDAEYVWWDLYGPDTHDEETCPTCQARREQA
jgi:hypothetical protein